MGRWRRKVVDPLVALLKQGTTPERLAVSLAIGAAVGVFPIVGTATAICAALALAFRLNVVAIQAGNYAAFPLQLALLLPFVRLGERLLGAPHVPLTTDAASAAFRSGFLHALQTLSSALAHAVVGWLAVAPLAAVIIGLALRPLLRRTQLLFRARANGTAAVTAD